MHNVVNDKKCSLCDKNYEGMGNNPMPLKEVDERCCDTCNSEKVLPARIMRMMQGKPVY